MGKYQAQERQDRRHPRENYHKNFQGNHNCCPYGRRRSRRKYAFKTGIAKGVGAASGAGFDEITYEGYGPGGAAVIVECNTDNRNRAAADVRHAFTHHGGSIGTPGCVAWMFKKKGMIVVNKEAADEDTIMMIALDAGAEDVSTDGDSFEITTAPEDFLTVSDALEKEGIAVEASEVTMVPDNTVSLEGDAADVMNKLTGELEELDDVQDVYTNAELPEDME